MGDKTISDDQGIVNHLSNYFSSNYRALTYLMETTISNCGSHREEHMEDITVYGSDVLAAIDSLYENKISGPDEIFARILKECRNELVELLEIIFNSSLSSGDVPNDWKLANVTPVLRKGKGFALDNYRLISLTSLVCKLLEKIIKRKLQLYRYAPFDQGQSARI